MFSRFDKMAIVSIISEQPSYIVFQTGFDGWAIFLRLVRFFPGFIYPPHLSVNNNLFQEDNIFGTIASLTYGPQIQRHACVWS